MGDDLYTEYLIVCHRTLQFRTIDMVKIDDVLRWFTYCLPNTWFMLFNGVVVYYYLIPLLWSIGRGVSHCVYLLYYLLLSYHFEFHIEIM